MTTPRVSSTRASAIADRRQRLRQAAASSNRYLNAVIHQYGGRDNLHIRGKDRNTYAVVADSNNIAVRGAMAHVIQTLEDVRQTRTAYSDAELEQIALLEMQEAQALQRQQPQGHAEILRVVAQAIAQFQAGSSSDLG